MWNNQVIFSKITGFQIALISFQNNQDSSADEVVFALVERSFVSFYQLFPYRIKLDSNYPANFLSQCRLCLSSHQSVHDKQKKKIQFMHELCIVGLWSGGYCINNPFYMGINSGDKLRQKIKKRNQFLQNKAVKKISFKKWFDLTHPL